MPAAATKSKTNAAFWIISLLLLLWALGGVSIYVAYLVEGAERFASTAETAANREDYAKYVEQIPWWAIGAGIIAAAARLFGAVGLLLRRSWALPLYVVSTLFFAIALIRAFVSPTWPAR